MDEDNAYINDLKPRFRQRYGGMECRVYMVRENPSRKPISLNGPDDVYYLVRNEMGGLDREILLSVLLNGLNFIIGVEMVSMGALNSCEVTLREVFKSAILANASGIVLCHNHPSGSLSPSPEDIQLTNKIISAGELLGIKVHDHLIISHDGYKSIMNK
jgi:DNA repair protein RadC